VVNIVLCGITALLFARFYFTAMIRHATLGLGFPA
jgi:hypothetical protein